MNPSKVYPLKFKDSKIGSDTCKEHKGVLQDDVESILTRGSK